MFSKNTLLPPIILNGKRKALLSQWPSMIKNAARVIQKHVVIRL